MLIDKIQIGSSDFEAYIIKDENKLEAFAVYFQNITDPLVLFQQKKVNKKVEITLNTSLFNKLKHFKAKDSDLRKKHFKMFQEFTLNAEQKAKEIIFKDQKLKYISDIQLIKSLEKAYLLD